MREAEEVSELLFQLFLTFCFSDRKFVRKRRQQAGKLDRGEKLLLSDSPFETHKSDHERKHNLRQKIRAINFVKIQRKIFTQTSTNFCGLSNVLTRNN